MLISLVWWRLADFHLHGFLPLLPIPKPKGKCRFFSPSSESLSFKSSHFSNLLCFVFSWNYAFFTKFFPLLIQVHSKLHFIFQPPRPRCPSFLFCKLQFICHFWTYLFLEFDFFRSRHSFYLLESFCFLSCKPHVVWFCQSLEEFHRFQSLLTLGANSVRATIAIYWYPGRCWVLKLRHHGEVSA